MKTHALFDRIASRCAHEAGRPRTVAVALVVLLGWAMTGPLFHFSDTWQLVINTGTTIVTFLMVFVIQNTQNRDSFAIQVKLDELIRVSKAHNALLDLEELSQEELQRIRDRYEDLARQARRALRAGKDDTDSPLLKPEEKEAA